MADAVQHEQRGKLCIGALLGTRKEAAQRLGTTVENCVFVDDNLTAVTTARVAGMQTIAVYDALSEAFMAQMQETADQYVMDFSQIRMD